MAKARREQKAATCLWKTKVVVVAYWQWGGHKNRDEEKKREVFFAFPPRNSWWWHHMWKEAPTTRLFKKSGVQGNKKKWEGGRVVVVRAIKALRYLWHMFGSFLHPLLLPTFFSPIGLPPLNAEGEGELWEMGGGQMDTKSPKPMTTYSRRIVHSCTGEIGDFCPRNPRNSWRLCVWDERVFFRLHFPFLRNSSWKRDLRVDWLSSFAVRQEHVSDCRLWVPWYEFGLFLLALTFALEIQPTCKQWYIA